MYVHNLLGGGRAVPRLRAAPTTRAPYAEDGDTHRGQRGVAARRRGRPAGRARRVRRARSTRSTCRPSSRELGDDVRRHRRPLQHLLDSGGSSSTRRRRTPTRPSRLLDRRADRAADPAGQGREHPRLRPRPRRAHRSAARAATATSGRILAGRRRAPPASSTRLLTDLEPTLPVLLGNARERQPGRGGPPGRARAAAGDLPAHHRRRLHRHHRDGYGHVNLQYTNEPPPCTEGYIPPSQWRSPYDTSDGPIYLKARCASPSPYTIRGSNYAPAPQSRSYRVAPYDPRTGSVLGSDQEVEVSGLGPADVYGGDAWKWMLLGPTLEK